MQFTKSDIKTLLDNYIALGMKNDAINILNKFGIYLNINDVERYIKKIQKM